MKVILFATLVFALAGSGCKKSEFSSSVQRLKKDIPQSGDSVFNPNDPSTFPKNPISNLPYNPNDPNDPNNPANPNNIANPNNPNNPNNKPDVNDPNNPNYVPNTNYANGSDNAGTDLKPAADGSNLLKGSGFNCTSVRAGLIGRVYKLAKNTSYLPNFAAMSSVGTVQVDKLDIPTREWTKGFPGVPGLIEWFGIQFYAVLVVPETNYYTFKTNSDDGSKVYINNVLVLNNDGIHAPKVVTGAPVQLTKGLHLLKVDWYQGPKREIALQVYWSKAGGSMQIIPTSNLVAPYNCSETNLGVFN